MSDLTQLAEPASLVKIFLHILTLHTTRDKMCIYSADKMFSARVKIWNTEFVSWPSSGLVTWPQRCCVLFSDGWGYLTQLPGSFCTYSTCCWCRAVYVLFGPLSAFPCAVPVLELSHRFVTTLTGWGSGPSCATVSWQKESNKWIAVYNLCFAMKGLSHLFLGILCLVFACFSNKI